MRGEEARERIRRIFENGPRLAGFYSFAINNPHLSFWNAVQIYSANPNVTVCKSFDDWHEQDNRRIKRGEHGIVYYDEDNPWRKRHVFDISQTYGKERYRGVQHRMREKMLADCINGQNIFAGISRDRNSHYGTLRKEFLKTEFPMQYQILLMTGGLSAHLKKTEKAAQALKDEGGVLKKTPDYASTSAYRISYIQPYDMFPQTKHVETLICLERK